MDKNFAVIGLGRFGASVAKTLYEMGYEVMAVDKDPHRVQEFSEIVTYVVEVDSTDEKALRALGINNFDVVVVAIGEDIQSSIMTTLILQEIGVKKVVVKATNDLHGKVLYKIGAEKVVFPERDMGVRVVNHLISPTILDYIELADDYSIIEISAGGSFDGKSLEKIDVRSEFGCNVMAIKSDKQINIAPMAQDVIQKGDVLVVIGHNENLRRFESYNLK
ncbi:trk system potassium uptake protein TrkA [Marininema mesophilum]|uniref:Trk system potassium uptake protein TrkA n=1 Tax=Marininema mesophilum TaxID=1048340 RepID=A0A1H2WCV7_9BACL|nr:TrkA family potassium uptake protein [Marininema mesophilum]SDW78430.1 trk system potassium uptake protein TrkA [Marininema mesophilum]